ncbi:hypothetical protein CPTAbTP3Phi1_007 [Acinetobacter phage AbTP3phi1]|uniref:Uncharacterized protein n=1 Tax=Acinetobacter phage AbTP3phi1 TaxID=2920932 RepID=A0AC61TTA2_9CAUD|nr:hypothetical protein CPTAbTP3Phi1_007 [Acinetobacter phage AbTP3phi1]
MNTVQQSKDIYKELASRIFGVPINQVTPEQRARARCCLFIYVYQIIFRKIEMVKQTNTTFVEVDFAFDTDTRNKVGFWKFPEESEETDHHKATTTTQFSGEMTNYIETKGVALEGQNKEVVTTTLERFFALNPDSVTIMTMNGENDFTLELKSNIINK